IGNEHYLKLSLEIADWIEKHQLKADGKLYHTFKNGKATIEGFLEDYAFVISAWLDLYSVTFDENWLEKAQKMMEYVMIHFGDEVSKMFFFTDSSSALITRKMEITDNVISSSNSQMANNLFRLGTLLQREDYIERAKQMLSNVYGGMENYGSGYSNWSLLLMNFTQKHYETVIIGDDYKDKAIELSKNYIPQTILIASAEENSLELTKDRFKSGETLIYICEDKTCQQPEKSIDEALKILNKRN
ncbi:MAG: thioredoxin domain-containing protein, partial [Crocinitomicaceae bacterium]